MILKQKARSDAKPKIAILLAAYEGVSYIEEQINSILKQEDADITLFISVDLSTDNTYEFVKSLEKKNKSINVLPYGEKFGGASRNFFRLIRDVEINQYDFIAFSDQDDIWLKQKLKHACNIIKIFNYDAFSSDIITFSEGASENYLKKSFPQKKYDYLFEAGGPGCTYVIKSNALSIYKKFILSNWTSVNEVFLHDWVIYAFFRSQKYKWHIDNSALIYYRVHTSNVIGINSGFKAYFKRIKYVYSGSYKKEVNKIINLLKIDVKLNYRFFLKNFFQLRRRLRDNFILFFFVILKIF
jgi:rhamnosyltransferase